MDYNKKALKMHEENRGKMEIKSKVALKTREDMSTAYTPGVAEPCRKIYENRKDVYKYTAKGNLVAVVSDGSAVLGLGNIGAEASMPVMEGKCILFKAFGEVDAFPICLNTQDVDEIVETIIRMSPTFGGINLEDIASPRCVQIEEKLKEKLDIPIFHDDQHGTAVVVTAALINALKIVKKEPKDLKIVINGAGAAGFAITKMLYAFGVKNLIICDSKGIIHHKREGLNFVKKKLLKLTNKESIQGDLSDAIIDADVFVGVSVKDTVDQAMVKSMKTDPIIFAMANPDPEIIPSLAIEAGAKIVGTGRSDYDNQINNVLAFPGIFRGALDAMATDINEEMKLAAAKAIAEGISEEDLNCKNIIPSALDISVSEKVAKAVYQAAIKTGVAQIK